MISLLAAALSMNSGSAFVFSGGSLSTTNSNPEDMHPKYWVFCNQTSPPKSSWFLFNYPTAELALSALESRRNSERALNAYFKTSDWVYRDQYVAPVAVFESPAEITANGVLWPDFKRRTAEGIKILESTSSGLGLLSTVFYLKGSTDNIAGYRRLIGEVTAGDGYGAFLSASGFTGTRLSGLASRIDSTLKQLRQVSEAKSAPGKIELDKFEAILRDTVSQIKGETSISGLSTAIPARSTSDTFSAEYSWQKSRLASIRELVIRRGPLYFYTLVNEGQTNRRFKVQGKGVVVAITLGPGESSGIVPLPFGGSYGGFGGFKDFEINTDDIKIKEE